MLAVLVVKDGADWLKRSLAALARQSYERLGVLAVDNASSDGSGKLLRDLLGPRRVVSLRENVGFPGAVARAMEIPAAREADFLLLLHDDTVLHPDAVAGLVAAAEGGVGVVGPKVLDGERRVLREIGYTIDRFGYRYSALEEGEIDQGQHDSPREVLFVSGTAMLVARDAWLRAGPPDARLRPSHGDLDFCWRVRIAGFRVVMDPSAVVYHEAAGDAGLREGARSDRTRYHEERSALTAMLKNYRLGTLLWVMPMYLVQGVAKVALFLLTRRFPDARQVLAAWAWTLWRFPGTVRRRVRLHAVRAVKEREVTATMAPTSARLRRWAGQVSAVLFPARGASELAPEEEIALVPLRQRVGGFLGRYPAPVALGIGLLLTLVAFRGVLFASPLEGGATPTFPDSARDVFAAYLDGTVPAGFGGADGASPALVPLGLLSVLTLGNPRTLAWIIVALTPLLAGVTAYRAALRRTGAPGAAVAAGASYALSAVVLWAASEGRVGEMAFLVGLPWILGRIADPFERPVGPPLRWALGTAVVLAITGSFFPAAWAPVAIATAVTLIVGGRRERRLAGAGIALATLVMAGVLAFPFVLTLARVGVGRSAELGIAAEFGSILRLSPGEAPGSWLPALFLPVGGVLGFALATQRAAAWRGLVSASLALPLAWLAAAGYLPSAAAEPIAYL
ncbi:MAG TPA: glycosyltransferase family 2 protein, partial [Actinomycetota bacterium]